MKRDSDFCRTNFSMVMGEGGKKMLHFPRHTHHGTNEQLTKMVNLNQSETREADYFLVHDTSPYVMYNTTDDY